MRNIVTNDLRKTYNDGTEALSGINIDCSSGKIYCVLGVNGAGKTTLIRILSTQLLPSSGSAHVQGFDVVKEASEVRSSIAVVPQDVRPSPSMSAWQHVYWYLASRGFKDTEAKSRSLESLKTLELMDVKDKLAAKLSGGQMKRIIVAAALATGTDLIFLDEPTAGLDPIGRRYVWDALRKMLKDERTILITTHHMDEAELFADHVLIMHKGKIVASSTPSELKSTFKYKFKIVIEQECPQDYSSFGKSVQVGDRTILYIDNERKLSELAAEISRKGYTFSVRPIDLEDVFFEIVGENSNVVS